MSPTTSDALPGHLHSALATALPRARLGASRLLGEGWGSIAYRVRDPGGDWTIKVPRAESRGAITGDLELEAGVLPVLAAAGLPVGREATPVRAPDGRLLALAYRYVDGVAATRVRLAGDAARALFACEVGRLLARLHGIDISSAHGAGVPELDLWRGRYAPMIEDCRPHLPVRSAAWVDETAERFASTGGTAEAPRTLVHGDISPAHLLLDGGGALAGLIDLGDAMIADAAIDLAGFLWGYGWPLTERLLEAYVQAGATIDGDLRRRMQFYVDVVPLFLVRSGDAVDASGDTRRAGIRQLAARAAAATRRSRRRSQGIPALR